MVPDVLLPSVTCRAEFVPYFLNSLQDWTTGFWSSRNTTSSTPVKVQTPVTGLRSAQHSFLSVSSTPASVADQLTSSTCTPGSNQKLESCQHSSVQRLSSVKRCPDGLSESSPPVSSPLEVNSRQLQTHSAKRDFARHRPLRQHNAVIHTEYFTPPAKEHQGRALFIDGSTPRVRKSSGKHRTPVRDKTEKVEKAPVPLFNLDSNTDFPDMKTSQRYFACFVYLFISDWVC